jgi:hypothetical protein
MFRRQGQVLESKRKSVSWSQAEKSKDHVRTFLVNRLDKAVLSKTLTPTAVACTDLAVLRGYTASKQKIPGLDDAWLDQPQHLEPLRFSVE